MPSDPATPTDAPIDVAACLRMGLTGALGAVPGTLAAHPFDVLKIRQQTTSTGSYASAVRAIRGSSSGLAGFYFGLRPALEQRAVARFPMFYLSELYTQGVQRHLGLTGTEARAVGSVGSGYSTGVLAALAEYRKKLLSQRVVAANEAAIGRIVAAARRTGNVGSLLRRLHAAGACSAVFDSCFFASQHHLASARGWSAPASYGAAASCAVVAAFYLDTCVARMMVVPPGERVPGLLATAAHLARSGGVGAGFRGLAARMCEFGVSYSATGAVSVVVGRAMAGRDG